MTNFGKSLGRILKKYIKNGVKATGAKCESCGSESLERVERMPNM